MARGTSPSPFIKDEPEEFSSDPIRFFPTNGYNMTQQFNQFNSNQSQSVDPSQLTMGGLQRGFGSQQNLSASFIGGNSGIADDELADSLLSYPDSTSQNANAAGNGFSPGAFSGARQMNQGYFNTANSAPTSTHSRINQPYPGTNQSNIIQHTFMNGFDSFQFQPQSQQPQYSGRGSSDSRAAGNSQNVGNLPLSPDQNYHGQPIQAAHRRQLSYSTMDGTPGSSHSFVDSPLSSPQNHLNSAQISEVVKTKHASLPTNFGDVAHSAPVAAYQTQEAKKRRRRESHNLVERRRRDNINERIQELSHLVPAHRLDDEKIRKHLMNNTPLSPTYGTSMSPPGNSLLAGSSGRRAPGNITQGLPIEDKDKGPNKGDILNGAVSWTRDLMWMLHRKLQQENDLLETISSLGGVPPLEVTEDEQRMRTELMDALERNDVSNFEYSRGQGSGLYVPKHTTISGEALSVSSVNVRSGGNAPDQLYTTTFWGTDFSGVHSAEPDNFKEEDEYEMELS